MPNSENLSPSQQELELRATEGGNIRWTINGQIVTPNVEGRVFWRLQKGTWKIVAASAGAQSSGTFIVREP